MMKLAIYDMDKTITHAPTWTPFLIATARARNPARLLLLPVAALAMLGYAAKLYDRATLKQTTQRLLIGRSMTIASAMQAAGTFADRIVATGVFAEARERIAADRAQGYQIVMATASYRFYAEAIAARLGIDAVIATESRIGPDGDVLAVIDGENCYGPAKLRMIQAWMKGRGIARKDAHVRFYSDHVSDAPALGWADEAFAVNAHGPLKVLAKARGWAVEDWVR